MGSQSTNISTPTESLGIAEERDEFLRICLELYRSGQASGLQAEARQLSGDKPTDGRSATKFHDTPPQIELPACEDGITSATADLPSTDCAAPAIDEADTVLNSRSSIPRSREVLRGLFFGIVTTICLTVPVGMSGMAILPVPIQSAGFVPSKGDTVHQHSDDNSALTVTAHDTESRSSPANGKIDGPAQPESVTALFEEFKQRYLSPPGANHVANAPLGIVAVPRGAPASSVAQRVRAVSRPLHRSTSHTRVTESVSQNYRHPASDRAQSQPFAPSPRYLPIYPTPGSFGLPAYGPIYDPRTRGLW